jgi:hypothetical protein
MPAAIRAAGNEEKAYAIPLAIAAAALLLCWPAFFNGYPLATIETAHQLEGRGAGGTERAGPFFYGAFLHAFARHSLWPVILAQGLVIAHLIYLTVRVTCGLPKAEIYLWVVAGLAAFSSLPWFVSLVLPDVAVGIMVLGLFLLGFAPEALGSAERWYVVALTAIAAAVDATALILAIGLVVPIAAFRFGTAPHAGARIRAVTVLALPIAVAAAGHLAVNLSAGRGPVIAPSTSLTMLLGMIRDGTAQRYLVEHCAERRFVLCDYAAELRREPDALPAGADDPLSRALREEAGVIVAGVLRAYPGRHLGHVAENTLRQLFAFDADEWLVPERPNEQRIGRSIRAHYRADYEHYAGARQSSARISASVIGIWHGFWAIAGFTLSAFLAAEFARRGDRLMVALFIVVSAALLGNALMTGGLGEVLGRNQSRIAWLAVLYGAIATMHFCRCSSARSPERAE